MANVILFFRIVVSISYISISFSQENQVSSTDSFIVKILKGLGLQEKTLTIEQYKFLLSHQERISKLEISNAAAALKILELKLQNYNAEDVEHIAKMYYCAHRLRTVIKIAPIVNLLNPKEITNTVSETTECVSKAIESRTKSLKEIFKNLLYNVTKRYMAELKPTFEKAYDNLKLSDLIQQPTNQSVNCKQLYDVLSELKISHNCEDGWKIYMKQKNIIWKNIDYQVDLNKNIIEGTIILSTDFQKLIGETETNQVKWTKPVIELLIEVKELNSTLFNYFLRQCDSLTCLQLDKPANLDEIFKDTKNTPVDKNLAKALLDLPVNGDDSDSTAYQVFLNNDEWITWARKYEYEDKFLSDLPFTRHVNTLNKMTDIHLEGIRLYAGNQCSHGLKDYKILVRAFIHFLRNNDKKVWTNRLKKCVGTVIKSNSKGFKRIVHDLRNSTIIKHAGWKDLPEEEIVLKACNKVVLLYNITSSFIDVLKNLPKSCKVEKSDYRKFVNGLSFDSDLQDVAVVLSGFCN